MMWNIVTWVKYMNNEKCQIIRKLSRVVIKEMLSLGSVTNIANYQSKGEIVESRMCPPYRHEFKMYWQHLESKRNQRI